MTPSTRGRQSAKARLHHDHYIATAPSGVLGALLPACRAGFSYAKRGVGCKCAHTVPMRRGKPKPAKIRRPRQYADSTTNLASPHLAGPLQRWIRSFDDLFRRHDTSIARGKPRIMIPRGVCAVPRDVVPPREPFCRQRSRSVNNTAANRRPPPLSRWYASDRALCRALRLSGTRRTPRLGRRPRTRSHCPGAHGALYEGVWAIPSQRRYRRLSIKTDN